MIWNIWLKNSHATYLTPASLSKILFILCEHIRACAQSFSCLYPGSPNITRKVQPFKEKNKTRLNEQLEWNSINNNIKSVVTIHLYDNSALLDKTWNWIYFTNLVKEKHFVQTTWKKEEINEQFCCCQCYCPLILFDL